MKKRLLSAILSFTLAITGLPIAGLAYAESSPETTVKATVANTAAVASALEMQNAIYEGKEFLEITDSFSVNKTVYIPSSVTVFASEDVTVTRAEGFLGDMFVVGETADGKNSVAENGKAVTLNIGLEKDDAKLTFDGADVDANGTCFYISNHSDVNMYGNVTVQNFTKTSNSRLKDSELSKGALVGGAAVIVSSGSLNLYGASFISDTVSAIADGASSLGGAIYNYGTLRIYDATFSACSAQTGGAIYNYRTVQIMNGTFTENSAAYGAAIAQADSQYAQTVMGNSAECKDGILFSKNKAVSCGGGFYSSHSTSASGTEISSNGLTIYADANVRFADNTAGNYGAGIYSYATIYIDGAEFTGNVSTGTSYGGGACTLQSGGNSSVLKNCTFTGNKAAKFGGAIYVHGNDCTAYNCDFTKNTSGNRGGAVYVCVDGSIPSSYTVYNNTYTENVSEDNGGAIAYTSGTKCRIYNSEFIGNKAGAQAGAVWVYTGNSGEIIQNCRFTGNTALGSTGGGAVSSSNSGTKLSLFNIIAENNTAPNGMGGFYYTTTTGVTSNIKGLTFNGNTSANAGSLIYANTYLVVMNVDKSSVVNSVTGEQPDWTVGVGTSSKTEIGVKSGTLALNAYTAEIPPVPTEEDTTVAGEIVPSEDADLVFSLAEAEPQTDSSYNPGNVLTSADDFCSRGTSSYEIDGVGTVSANTFAYQPGNAEGNPTVGEGLLIFRAMQYKKANPTENVRIDLSAYRVSPETAVNINPDSPYYGYLRSLKTADTDEYGFVRISYLLVTAAKMGIEVHVIGQRAASGDSTLFADYFASHMNDACDTDYVSDKAVRDFLTCTENKWDYTTKSAADLMHTKACAVSAYLDADGVAHGGTVWLSSTNLDNVKADGTNGYDALQTGIIISDHSGIYQTTVNYLNLVRQYSKRNEVYLFRNLVNKMNKEQIDALNAGQTVPSDTQIVYRDDVFELYFSAIGGDNAKWDTDYNPISKQIQALADSDGYIWFAMNNPKFKSFAWSDTLQTVLAKAFNDNRNAENRISVNIDTLDEDSVSDESKFDASAYDGLTVGTDIEYKSLETNDYSPIHSKDILLSYEKDSIRSFVTLITSMNLHEGSASYQSNFALIIKEENCNEGSIFRSVAENTMKGFIEPALDASAFTLSESAVSYTGEPVTPEVISELYSSEDYTVSYENNLSVGTAKVTVTGRGAYTGTVTKEFSVVPFDLSTVASEVSVLSQTYTGEEVTPLPTVTANGRTLIKDSDYTLSYENNIHAGENACVTVTGIGNYTGSFTKQFTISKELIGDYINIAPVDDVVYNGRNQEPEIVVTDKNGEPFDSASYTVSFNNGEAHSSCGEVTVTVSGIGLYSGSACTTFNILPLNISELEFNAIDDVTYNGTAFEPEISIKTEGVFLQKDTDYTVAYSSNTNAGTATVTVTGIGNCTGNKLLTFTVNSIPAEEINVSVENAVYSGEEITPVITATADSITLTSADYDTVLSDNINAGTGSVTLTFKGNFEGTVTKSFVIEKANLEKASVTVVGKQYYTGSAVCPKPIVVFNGRILTKDSDYTVSYFGNTAITKGAVVSIQGIGNFTGEAGTVFSIIKDTDISHAIISPIADVTYNAAAQTPSVTVTLHGTVLTEDTDYTVAYSDNTNPGTAKVTITGLDGYSGTAIAEFTVNPSYDLTFATIGTISAVTYNGKAQKPAVKVTMAGEELTNGTDYTVSYSDNTNPGTAKVTVTGMGSYSGTKTVGFTVNPSYDLTLATIGTISAVTYNGKAQKPTVKVTLAGKVLTSGTDYTVAYSDNTNPGTAKVTVTGKGSYSGKLTKTFTIKNTNNLSYAVIGTISAVTYTGNAQKPTVSVTLAGTKLKLNKDYKVTYSNNVNASSAAKVTVTGIGSYTGKLTKTFTIKKASVKSLSVASSLTYTGKKLTPKVTFGNKTVASGEYSLSYYSDSAAKKKVSSVTNVGVYYVKVTSKGVNFASGSIIVKLTVSPKATAFKSISAEKAGFTAKWTAQTKGVTGYQIRYSLSKTMSKPTTVTVGKNTTAQKKVTKLKSKTTYYVQIRTVTKVGKTTYYSDWSTVKSVKTK